MWANLITRVALPFSIVAGLAILAWVERDMFISRKSATEPTQQDVAKAVGSGTKNTHILLSTDRLAIISHITAYGHLIDEARWEDWYGLFSDDVSFEIAALTSGTRVIKGKKALRDYVEDRFIKNAASYAALRRHTMGNIQVVSQTEMAAYVRSYLHIANAPVADKWSVFTTGTYNANLERRGGKWIITRWTIETRPTSVQ
jgi:3-phenylpropionate/cinnamic acid dioxygenase small subunit